MSTGTLIRAPKANAFAERFVRTVRSECLDHVLVYGRRHLDRVLRAYVTHHTEERPHRWLDLATPAAAPRHRLGTRTEGGSIEGMSSVVSFRSIGGPREPTLVLEPFTRK